MKKQKLLLIASVLLLTCSCQDNISSSQDSQATSNQDSSSLVSSSSSSAASSSETSSSSSSVIVEHSITYTSDLDHPDTEVSIHKNNTDCTEITKAKAGETVLVNLYSSSETITGGYANDIKLVHYEASYYKFTMPDEDVVITITYEGDNTPSSSIQLKTASGVNCDFYSSVDDAIVSIGGDTSVSKITTANINDTIVVSFAATIADIAINHVYNSLEDGTNKVELSGAYSADFGDLSSYGVYSLTVPSTGVYISID